MARPGKSNSPRLKSRVFEVTTLSAIPATATAEAGSALELREAAPRGSGDPLRDYRPWQVYTQLGQFFGAVVILRDSPAPVNPEPLARIRPDPRRQTVVQGARHRDRVRRGHRRLQDNVKADAVSLAGRIERDQHGAIAQGQFRRRERGCGRVDYSRW